MIYGNERRGIRASTELRRLLREGPLLPMVWGGTAHHAQLAQASGFKAFGVSGSLTSTQLLGLPDAGLMTLTEIVQNTQRVCRAVPIPVIVDCDTGFGNAINVRRTVEEIICAGAAGLFIEDQVSPKRCGFVKGKEVIPLEEAEGKYRAACDLRADMDPDFLIIARSDARGAVGGSLEEVVRRGKAYLAAGADVFYAEALQSREEIRYVRDALPGCLLHTIPSYIEPPLSEQEMIDLGLCFAWVFVEQIGAAAIFDFLNDYRRRGETARIEAATRLADHPMGGSPRTGYRIYDLAGFPKIFELEERYLPKAHLDRYDASLGEYDPRIKRRIDGA